MLRGADASACGAGAAIAALGALATPGALEALDAPGVGSLGVEEVATVSPPIPMSKMPTMTIAT